VTRVALFGGSFNPPHVGHVLAIGYVLSTQPIDRVVVVPVFEHALGKQLVPFEHRAEMARRAFGWLPSVEVSTIESELGAPSRTLRTIEALEQRHPDWRLRLLVGSDILGELAQWHAYDEIERRAPPLVITRAGAEQHSSLPAMLPEVSSTRVRRLLTARQPGAIDPELEASLPRAVLEYIEAHDLYRESLSTPPPA
jgi:nicotinate-nucleotide adenylyltransferase